MDESDNRQRFSFGLRFVFGLVFLISVALAAWVYSRQASRPDVTITAEDIAWASNLKIWKLDLSRFDDVTEIEILLLDPNGKVEKSFCNLGSGVPLDTSRTPVTVVMEFLDESVEGRLRFGGNSVFFDSNEGFELGMISNSRSGVLTQDRLMLATESEPIGNTGNQRVFPGTRSIVLQVTRGESR